MTPMTSQLQLTVLISIVGVCLAGVDVDTTSFRGSAVPLASSSILINDTSASNSDDITHALTDIRGAASHTYNLRDDQGVGLDALRVLPSSSPTVSGGRYLGFSHAYINGIYESRLSVSDDLVNFRFVRTLATNTDMPYAALVEESTWFGPEPWIVILHEKWMGADCALGWELYTDVASLIKGKDDAHGWIPTGPVFGPLVGTPNIYSAVAHLLDDYHTVSVNVKFGFHYNDKDQVDVVGTGTLTGIRLGQGHSEDVPNAQWSGKLAEEYNKKLVDLGAVGNKGDRDSFVWNKRRYSVQEGNLGHQPPTEWKEWRVFLYEWSDDEMKTGVADGSGSFTMLSPVSDAGSTAFGNPGASILPCPDAPSRQCIFVTYFLFGEGAKSGEAGSCGFVHTLPGFVH